MILAPYAVDVTMYRWPLANFSLLGLITLISFLAFGASVESGLGALVLDGWYPAGLVGHVFLHGGLMHLFGNMLFLWTFGNAVCSKVGNVAFIALFFLLAAISGTFHNIFDGGRAIGASGAINGVVGLFLVYFPRNDVRCFWSIIIRMGTFGISSGWMILLWLLFDIWGAVSGSAGVAYWAHLGGFIAGVSIGVASLKYGWVKMTRTECSLLDVLDGRR